MSCETWRELMIDLLVDELEEDQRIQLEQHLADCPSCTAEERRLRGLLQLSFAPESYEVDPVIEARLLERVQLGRTRERSMRGRGDDQARAKNRGGWTLLPRLFARPIPAYAVLLLMLGAILAGIWAGHGERMSLEGDRATRPSPALDTPDGVSRPPDGLAGTEHGSAPGRVELRAAGWMAERDVAFAIAPSDAIALARAISPDTL
jgi:hypothetical protein